MMKKLLFSYVFAFSFTYGNAQIPNGDFEAWTNTGTYEDPDGFVSLNFLSFVGVALSTFKSDTAHGGSYSCENRCVAYTGFGGPDTICGLVIGTFPSTQRPLNIEGWYQLIGGGVDHDCYLSISLTKWNSTTGIPDTVAAGLYGTSTPTGSNWTFFNLPLQYFNGMEPDSIHIVFGVNGNAGTIMRMDDLAFNGSVASIDDPAMVNLHLYPNPADSRIELSFEKASDHLVTITAMDGRVVAHQQVESAEIYFSTADYPAGVYLISVEDVQNGAKTTKRFFVRH